MKPDKFVVMNSDEVEKKFPGAHARLLLQRHNYGHGVKVKFSAIGPGGWSFGLSGDTLFLYNEVFHWMPTYKTVYEWTGVEWKHGEV